MNLFVQAVQFIGISGIGWLLDFAIFNSLHLAVENVAVCNWISSLVAISFVFAVSTRRTFVQKDGGINLKLKFVIYVFYQLLLILAMSALLSVINTKLQLVFSETDLVKYSAMLAKIAVTPITMILNFIVMKFLIERI